MSWFISPRLGTRSLLLVEFVEGVVLCLSLLVRLEDPLVNGVWFLEGVVGLGAGELLDSWELPVGALALRGRLRLASFLCLRLEVEYR